MVRLGSPEQCRSVTLTTTSALLRVADVMLSQLSHEHESATQQASFRLHSATQAYAVKTLCWCSPAVRVSICFKITGRANEVKIKGRANAREFHCTALCCCESFYKWLQRKQRFADFPVAVPATDKLEKTANFCCFMSKARLLQRYCFLHSTAVKFWHRKGISYTHRC